MRLQTAGALCVFAVAVVNVGGPSQDWVRGNAEVRRLDPGAFPQLPGAVAAYLRERQCTIPQSFAPDGPHGVIKGHFISADQVDWAVLCSVNRVSTILVFRSGGISRVDELDRRDDADYLQIVGDKRVGFSRAISVATPSDIDRYGRNAKMTRVDHDGIDDAFVEKASTILYWDRGRWLELEGSD